MVSGVSRNAKTIAARKAMQEAGCYSQWFEAAQEWEQYSGAHEWRVNPMAGICDQLGYAAILYPHRELQAHRSRLEALREAGEPLALLQFLTESLHRLLNEISDASLYQHSPLGSKMLTQDYLHTVGQCIEFLVRDPRIPVEQKLAHLESAQRNLGAPALMLSGGGTFGIYHLGVVKALLEQNLLPDIISGSSMGSIAAGMLATHTEDEIRGIFAHPHDSHHRPLKWLPVRDMLRRRLLLDEARLMECVRANMGDLTFAQAHARTGRTVSITVSPTRSGQKPRILNHLTSPDTLIASASKASCSVPGLFAPVQLQQCRHGTVEPYCVDERWSDGSFATDIPRARMSRLFNVNFFIVSQANPHILPFVQSRQKTGVLATMQDVLVESLHAQSKALLKVVRRRYNRPPLALLD